MAVSNLGKRLISALFLAPVVLLAAWWGGWLWQLLIAVGGIICVYEWVRMTQKKGMRPVWFMGGLLYLVPPLVFLFNAEGENEPRLLFLLLIWAIDTGAYVFGRLFGGPKIAPKISPNKTWAGLLGGIITCLLVLIFMPNAFKHHVLINAALIACVAQAGDFFMSWVKRRFGVKDTGALIPGHGGLLDRVDGLLAVAWLAMLFYLVPSIV